MSMISRLSEHIHSVPYIDVSDLQDYSVNTNIAKLSGIKKLIESCFILISGTSPTSTTGDSVSGSNNNTSTTSNNNNNNNKVIQYTASSVMLPPMDHEYNGHIMSLDGDKCSLLSLATSKWTSIQDVIKRPYNYVPTSVVYARGDVYVFGGPDAPNTYSRFSLAEKQCYDDDIFGIIGCTFASACFDGNRLIYLVGGNHQGHKSDRVDCFNIDTQQFSSVGTLPHGLAFPCIYYHNNAIIVVGGEKAGGGGGGSHTEVLLFNVRTHVTDVLIKDISISQYDFSCFDGEDNIYVHAKDGFMRYTLSTKQPTKLSRCPTYGQLRQMVYDRSVGIICLGGKGNNYRYTTQDDHWTRLNDDDPVANRTWYGACLIRD
ncbi:hypothetical protein SAMD00019534_101460 [Acytostelium subglobosum LB1]|uniref:hypothetical protein n=1 Tax=Acytostelium subglobosum LB1 TaxID=1410327 RepID=UPI000644E65A|nr:hypothetical protein SAMD00019534_101460 [Acytostelium subglobosum LB1]GAM26971.1 hypothetical protein SAMD00019534_101460 [Acytostelium subglobosum LB1]|eukprot:XP_012750239.1 hypothetical protein SAMD00019534_101460 [Acytostelium subglobosum LB1]